MAVAFVPLLATRASTASIIGRRDQSIAVLACRRNPTIVQRVQDQSAARCLLGGIAFVIVLVPSRNNLRGRPSGHDKRLSQPERAKCATARLTIVMRDCILFSHSR